MLNIRNLTKRYGDKTAVDNLTLSIAPGEIYGFIGHNGAGKTTTIRAVVGVMEFDSGEIYVDGLSIKQDPVGCKQKLAYLPDNPDLYEYMTGIQYLNFLCDIYGVSAAERESQIEKYGGLLELTPNLGDLIGSYSHGMKQKLALIGAFAHSPRLMVMDEPFVGLDPAASFKMKEMMHELCKTGVAFFFSTHILEVAEKLCNKIAIIKGGKLVASGPTAAIRGDASLEQVFMEVTEP